MAAFLGRCETRWSAGRVCKNGGHCFRTWQRVDLIAISEIGKIEVDFCLPHRGKTRAWNIARYGRDEGWLRGSEKLVRGGQRLRSVRVEPDLKNVIDVGMEGEKDRIARSEVQVSHIAADVYVMDEGVRQALEIAGAADWRFLGIAAKMSPILVIDEVGNSART